MNGVLLDILLVLAAKVAAEGAERMGLPAVAGEILAGRALGPSALGLVDPSEVRHTRRLLQIGTEMDLGELGAVGRASLQVAVLGVALPFVAGWAVASAACEPSSTAFFVGAALTATSDGITPGCSGTWPSPSGARQSFPTPPGARPGRTAPAGFRRQEGALRARICRQSFPTPPERRAARPDRARPGSGGRKGRYAPESAA